MVLREKYGNLKGAIMKKAGILKLSMVIIIALFVFIILEKFNFHIRSYFSQLFKKLWPICSHMFLDYLRAKASNAFFTSCYVFCSRRNFIWPF